MHANQPGQAVLSVNRLGGNLLGQAFIVSFYSNKFGTEGEISRAGARGARGADLRRRSEETI